MQKPYDPEFYTKRNENIKYMSTQTTGHKCPNNETQRGRWDVCCECFVAVVEERKTEG